MVESPLTLVIGFAAATISGFLSIKFLLGFLRTRSLYPFAVYCWVAGLLSILLAVLAIR